MAHKPLPQVLTQTPLHCIMIVFVGIISYSLDIYPRQVNQIFRKVKNVPLDIVPHEEEGYVPSFLLFF